MRSDAFGTGVISKNTWGSGYLMTLLGTSTLKVSVTDHGDYWATSSEHFLRDLLQILSVVIQLSIRPFPASGTK